VCQCVGGSLHCSAARAASGCTVFFFHQKKIISMINLLSMYLFLQDVNFKFDRNINSNLVNQLPPQVEGIVLILEFKCQRKKSSCSLEVVHDN